VDGQQNDAGLLHCLFECQERKVEPVSYLTFAPVETAMVYRGEVSCAMRKIALTKAVKIRLAWWTCRIVVGTHVQRCTRERGPKSRRIA